MIKVVAANVVMDVLDRAIQVHGSLGMSDDTPLAGMWRFSRMLKVADGPDEVHKMVIARRELNRAAKEAEAEPSRPTRRSLRRPTVNRSSLPSLGSTATPRLTEHPRRRSSVGSATRAVGCAGPRDRGSRPRPAEHV